MVNGNEGSESTYAAPIVLFDKMNKEWEERHATEVYNRTTESQGHFNN